VVIEDFPDDDPRAQPDARLAAAKGAEAAGRRDGRCPGIGCSKRRSALLLGARQRWITGAAQHGRAHGLPVSDAGRYVGNAARQSPPEPTRWVLTPLILRFAVDDLKAHHLEAAATGTASSRQLGDWLWNDTAAGAAITPCARLASERDERLKLIGGIFWCRHTGAQFELIGERRCRVSERWRFDYRRHDPRLAWRSRRGPRRAWGAPRHRA